MSTAGKVLVVLFLLASLIWLVLTAGVAQLNTNGNTKVHDLTVQVEKLAADLEQTQHDIASLLDQTSQTQEQIDRDFTVLRVAQSDLEKTRSQILETLARVQYQLATVEETVKSAQTALEHRSTELQEEGKALADAKSEVQVLMAQSSQLMDKLTTLRNEFKTTYRANVDLLGKRGQSRDGQRGRTN